MGSRSVFVARTVTVLLMAVLVVSCAVAPTPFEAIPFDYTGGVRATKVGIAYGPGRSHKADLYVSPARRGTIVYLHGGGWVSGDRHYVPSLLLHQVTRGWDVVSIDYRMAGEAPFPAAVHDASDAISWVYRNGAQHGLDTHRVVISGGSAGGNIAALLAYGANDTGFPGADLVPVDGLLSLAGVYDMRTAGFGELDRPGGWLHGVPRGRYDSSPNVWLDAQDPPTLAVHGVEDPLVSVAQVRALATRSRSVGHGARMKVIETSHPSLEQRCRSHFPWCGAPVTEVNKFLDELPRANLSHAKR